MRGLQLSKMIAAHGIKPVVQELSEAVSDFCEGKTGGLNPFDFNFRDAFLETVKDGHQVSEAWRREEIVESDAVNTAAFQAISRTFIAGMVRSAYANPGFVFTGLIRSERSTNPGIEITPEVAPIGEQNQVVGEGQEYPVLGLSENWTERPLMKKRGSTIFLTKETITMDRTGVIQEEARQLGYWLGLNKELRLIDVAIGYTNTYKRNGTASNTYQTATPWINDQSNPFADWTDYDDSRKLFYDMRHPDTGLPIFLGSETIVAPATKRATFSRVLSATTVETGVTTDALRTIGGNPISGVNAQYSELLDYQIAARGLATAANARSWWLHGNLGEAFGYAEISPLMLEQASDAAIAQLSFTRDIIAGYKASEKGVAFVKEPRKVVRNKN